MTDLLGLLIALEGFTVALVLVHSVLRALPAAWIARVEQRLWR